MYEKKGKAVGNILMIGCLAGGCIKKDICEEISGGKEYNNVVMSRMRKKGYAETVFGMGVRTLHIQKAGVDKMAESIPGIKEKGESGAMNFRKDRAWRNLVVSQVVYNMQLSGITYEPLEKPSLYVCDDYERTRINPVIKEAYYLPGEIKKEMDEKTLDELRRSRCHGIYVSDSKMLMLYNIEDSNIKFVYKTENDAMAILKRFYTSVGTDTGMVIYGNGFCGIDFIKKNNDIISKNLGVFQKRTFSNINTISRSCHCPMHYIPNGKEGVPSFLLLTHPEARRMIEKAAKRKIWENYGTDKRIISLLDSFIELYMKALGTSGTTESRETILCTENQKKYLEKEGNRVCSVKDETILEFCGY